MIDMPAGDLFVPGIFVVIITAMKFYTMPCVSVFCLPVLLFASGCFTETRTYSMSVKNDLAAPVSVCVTKTHGPPEPGWESPEELIQPPHPASDQRPPGMVIPAGKTLNAPPFTGDFDPVSGRAFLRIYAGTPSLTEMNAISPGSSDRMDVPLEPGLNRIEIKQAENGGMTAVRANRPWPATRPVVP
jgi:hypothetical protein